MIQQQTDIGKRTESEKRRVKTLILTSDSLNFYKCTAYTITEYSSLSMLYSLFLQLMALNKIELLNTGPSTDISAGLFRGLETAST